MSGHPRQKFPRGEGFHQIVVRARFNAFHAGFFAGPRRQKNHRQSAGGRFGAQSFQ